MINNSLISEKNVNSIFLGVLLPFLQYNIHKIQIVKEKNLILENDPVKDIQY